MQDGETVERFWQPSATDVVVSKPHIPSIALASPIKPGDPQQCPDHGVDRVPVLDVKEIEALAKDLRLVRGLDTEALARMQASQPTRQEGIKFLRRV